MEVEDVKKAEEEGKRKKEKSDRPNEIGKRKISKETKREKETKEKRKTSQKNKAMPDCH